MTRITAHSSWNPDTLSGAVVYAVIFLAAAWCLVRVLSFVIRRRGLLHKGDDSPSVSFLFQFGRIVIYVAAVVLYAHLIPSLQAMGTALLAGVSVASIVIGLAAQSTLSNLIAGVVLIIYRPFSVGDRIQLTAPTGLEIAFVKDITLGYTVLETTDSRSIVVPNSVIANQITVNLTQSEKRTALVVSFHLSGGADVAEARRLIVAAAEQHPKVVEVTACPATAIDGAGVTLTVKAWCETQAGVNAAQSDLIESLDTTLTEHNIRLAFPSAYTPNSPAGKGEDAG